MRANAQVWTSRYQARYQASLPNRPPISQRDWCRRMGYKDDNLLSRWMKLDAPTNQRIPVEHIPLLAIGMRLTGRERDRLMTARLWEMGRTDPGMKAGVEWAMDAGKRAASARRMKKPALSDDEASCWPLGILQTEQVAMRTLRPS